MREKFSKIKSGALTVLFAVLMSPPLMAQTTETSTIETGILTKYLGDETDVLHQRIVDLTATLEKADTFYVESQVREIRKIITILLDKIPTHLAGEVDPRELIYPLKQIGKHLKKAQRRLQSNKDSSIASFKRAARWCLSFHESSLLPLYRAQELTFRGIKAHEQKRYAEADTYYEKAMEQLLKARQNRISPGSNLDQISSDLVSLKIKNKKAQILEAKESKKIWNSLKKRFRKVQKTSLSLWERENFRY